MATSRTSHGSLVRWENHRSFRLKGWFASTPRFATVGYACMELGDTIIDRILDHAHPNTGERQIFKNYSIPPNSCRKPRMVLSSMMSSKSFPGVQLFYGCQLQLWILNPIYISQLDINGGILYSITYTITPCFRYITTIIYITMF